MKRGRAIRSAPSKMSHMMTMIMRKEVSLPIELCALHAKKSDAMVFGPGIGRNGDIFKIISRVLKEYCGTLVIDADGINALSENIDILKEKKCKVILTPHSGEMSRLTKMKAEEINRERVNTAKNFAKDFKVCVVLKGRNTVIADELGNVTINPTGNSGMATGGTGDVLSGVIAAFAAQGVEAYEAAVLGAYVHGLAGDFAKEDKGTLGLIATDVTMNLPNAIKYISDI